MLSVNVNRFGILFVFSPPFPSTIQINSERRIKMQKEKRENSGLVYK